MPAVGLLPLVAALGLWQLFGSGESLTFPTPEKWIDSLRAMRAAGILWPALMQTLSTFALALVVTVVLGVAIGMSIGANRMLERALTPLMDFLRSLPPPVVVPVGVLLLGATQTMSIAIVTFSVIWPIILNVASGMRSIPTVRSEMATSLGLGPVERLRKVLLPSLAPSIALAMRTVVSIALLVTLLVDILGAGGGVGRLIVVRQQSFDGAAVWGLLLVIGLFGYLLNVLLALAERAVFRHWPPSSRP